MFLETMDLSRCPPLIALQLFLLRKHASLLLTALLPDDTPIFPFLALLSPTCFRAVLASDGSLAESNGGLLGV